MITYQGVWRDPGDCTTDYPGLEVHDGRVSGSIVVGPSRLPLWAFIGEVVRAGWEKGAADYEPGPDHYDFDAEAASGFLYHLLEQRGEFGRLICVLADVERDEIERTEKADAEHWAVCPTRSERVCYCMPPQEPPWWRHEPAIERVRGALQRCLEVLSADVLVDAASEPAGRGLGGVSTPDSEGYDDAPS